MPESTRTITSQVFISYSRADREFVTRLISDLQAQNVSVWVDEAGLQPGTPDWEEALRHAIRQSFAIVLVASPSSRKSRYVKDELRIASMYQCLVLPIWVDGEEWMDSIPMGWGSTQFVDGRGKNYSTAVDQLVSSLKEQIDQAAGLPQLAPTKPDFISRNPYKGLRPFTENDAQDFFGREAFIASLIEAINSTSDRDPRFVAVLGPSGSGKSSVVMAGLLPQLRAGAVVGSQDWVYLPPVIPGQYPIENLAIALSKAIDWNIVSVLRNLEDPRGLHQITSAIAQSPRRVVLFIDQFEEIFTQTVDELERRSFIDLLVTASTELKGSLLILLTMRADFYDRPMNYSELGTLIKEHHESILPMSLAELRAVIEKPAALDDVQVTFEGGLVGDLLFDVRGEVGALPLLQFTLDQLFQRRDEQLLTQEAYREIGGIRGALAKHAEQTFLGLPSDEHRRLAKALFLRLVDPGATEQDTTRRRASLSELILPDPEQSRILRHSADIFVNARLLTTSSTNDGTREKVTIEVSHEALIREWPRLSGWVREARQDIQLQKKIASDTSDWIQQGKSLDLGMLYRGTRLIDAQEWMKRNVPSADESLFVETSAKTEAKQIEAQRRVAKRAQNFQRAAFILAAVGAIALILAIAASLIAGNAVNEVSNAQDAQTLAAKALGTSEANVTQAQANAAEAETQVAVAGQTLTPVPQTLTPVGATLQAGNTQVAVAQEQVIAAGQTLTPIPPTLTAAAQQISEAVNQAEQADFLVATAQTQVANARETLIPIPLTLTPVRATLEAAQAKVVEIQATGTIVAQNVEYQRQVGEALRLASQIQIESERSPEVAILIGLEVLKNYPYMTQAERALGMAVLQDRLRLTLSGHQDVLLRVAWSPDGTRIVTTSNDRTAKIWDAATGNELGTYSNWSDIISAEWSPDGKHIVTANRYSNEAMIWDASMSSVSLILSGHTDTVLDAAWSPDGKRIVTASMDDTAKVWDTTTGDELLTLSGHFDDLSSATWSPDGKRILTGSYDGTAKV